ncbi:MAG: hypothetical protein ACK5GP_03930 [bacterium]
MAAAVETVGNRINYLIEKGNHWFPFSVEEAEQAGRVEAVEAACGLVEAVEAAKRVEEVEVAFGLLKRLK